MRIAIISDIHSNLEALNRALKEIEREKVDEIICLGDIVGYGANPNECVDIVKELSPHVLLGNHDEAAIDLSKTEFFNPFARIAAEWTGDTLTEENKDYIAGLPLILERNGIFLVHASPVHPQEWNYILTPSDAAENFPAMPSEVCFIGHSHVPEVFGEDLWTRNVVKGEKFIVNVGSIGQPRDGNPKLSFGIFDTELWSYRNLRLDYDIELAAFKIKKAGLPKNLADRLFVGK
ncbi:MAG TPA: metallophosphoesterase family protein [Bacteroidota bacterium]|nr:metallophosphoesterase family protein [Bacteroidota bacterium]